jgi:hypothetical protein
MVITVIALAFLVVIAPYLLKDKGSQNGKRAVPDKKGITRELPKQAEQPAPERSSGQTTPVAQVAPVPPPEPAGKPGASKPEEPEQPAKPPEQDSTVPKQGAAPPPVTEKPEQSAPPAAKPGETVSPAPRDPFPKKGTSSAAPPAKAPVKPGAKEAQPVRQAPPPAKPAQPVDKGGGYAVQVGSIYKTKSEAQKVVKDLAAKGYKAIVRNAENGAGYYVVTSPCQQSKAYTLREQMKIQGLGDTKVVAMK